MDIILTLLVAGMAWGLGVLFGRRMRAGETPGMPTELHAHDHDEPLEDVAKQVDSAQHHETSVEKTEEFVNIRRSMGDGR